MTERERLIDPNERDEERTDNVALRPKRFPKRA